jgi:hypothetical protein
MSLLPNLDEMTDNEKMAVLESIQQSIAQSKEIQKQKIAANVDLVVQALKKIESDIRSRFDDVGNAIEKRVSTIKDGRDGSNGKDGRDGKDGKNGRDGAKGDRGERGQDGINGINGVDGVSVSNANIDFDGSLIITLSTGVQINVGEVVAPDLAERIKVITNGGGTAQSVLDTLASLQTQITNLIPSQTGNAGKYLTTNGTALSWATIAGSLSYLGTWNASTNTPTLTSSVGTNGIYYIVATAGSTNLNGITDWQIGDWLLFNGTVWQKIDQSNLVTSVAGRTGAITLANTDISGLGTMSTQNASSIAVTGGTINGTTIGATTATTGAFTTLTSNGATTFTANTASTTTGTGTLVITGGLGVSGRINAANFDGIIGANTAAAGTFTSLTDSGNLTFTGTGNRILGDFSNATFANRAMFQTSTTNGNTAIEALPNGTSGNATWTAYNNSDPTNASFISIGARTTTDARIESSIRGSGTYLPMTFYTGGAEAMRITNAGATALFGFGTSNPAVKLDVNGITGWQGGTTGIAGSIVGASSGINNGGNLRVLANTTQAANVGGALTLGGYYTSTTLSVDFGAILGAKENSTGGDAAGYLAFGTRPAGGNMTERMRIDSSGNVGIGTNSPIRQLSVGTPNGGASSVINMGSGTSSLGTLEFGDGTTGDDRFRGYVQYSHVDNSLRLGTDAVERMRIDSSGNLLVGANATSSFFDGLANFAGRIHTKAASTNYFWQTGTSGTRTYLTFITGSTPTQTGSITTDGTTTAYVTTSDYRLKEDIAPMTGALAKVALLKPVTYKWNSNGSNGQGFIAHELAEVCPDAVIGEKDAVDAEGNLQYQGIDTSFLVATLTAAIQEQQALITTLTARITALEQA